MLPDYHGAAKRYEELGMHQQLEDSKKVWVDRARRWLQKRQLTEEAEDQGRAKKPKKVHRAKSYHGVLAWDKRAELCAKNVDPDRAPRLTESLAQVDRRVGVYKLSQGVLVWSMKNTHSQFDGWRRNWAGGYRPAQRLRSGCERRELEAAKG